MRDAWSFTGRISIPFFFPPSPFLFFFFFFGTSSAQPAYDFCVMHQCAPLLIHETYKSIPSKQFSSLSFHLVIHVTPFRNHYGSIKRNVISWKKKYIYITRVDIFFRAIYILQKLITLDEERVIWSCWNFYPFLSLLYTEINHWLIFKAYYSSIQLSLLNK